MAGRYYYGYQNAIGKKRKINNNIFFYRQAFIALLSSLFPITTLIAPNIANNNTKLLNKIHVL